MPGVTAAIAPVFERGYIIAIHVDATIEVPGVYIPLTARPRETFPGDTTASAPELYHHSPVVPQAFQSAGCIQTCDR